MAKKTYQCELRVSRHIIDTSCEVIPEEYLRRRRPIGGKIGIPEAAITREDHLLGPV